MGMMFRTQNFGSAKQIYATAGDPKIELAQTIRYGSSLMDSLTTEVDGAKVILAGTIYPANDNTAIGVIVNDYDATYGDVHVAICVFGAIQVDALPAAPTSAALTALKNIIFVPINKAEIKVYGGDEADDTYEVAIKAGETVDLTVRIYGTDFNAGLTAASFTVGSGVTLNSVTQTAGNADEVVLNVTAGASAASVNINAVAAATVNGRATNALKINVEE